MSELVKAVKDFLTRDLLYIIGGCCVIVSFFYMFGRLPESSLSTSQLIGILAVGYVIGYGVQDGLSIIRIVTTRHLTKPSGCMKTVYCGFTGRRWKTIESELDFPKDYYEFVAAADGDVLSELRRIITLKHIGTTIGANVLVASVPLLFRALCTNAPFDWTLFGAAIVASAIFLTLSRLKGYQQTRYIYEMQDFVSQPTSDRVCIDRVDG